MRGRIGAFRWDLPQLYNIGVDVCDKWCHEPARIALIHKPPAGESVEYTFVEIRRLSNQAANLMRSAGLTRGDRIAVLLPQMPETAIAHVAIYKIGRLRSRCLLCLESRPSNIGSPTAARGRW